LIYEPHMLRLLGLDTSRNSVCFVHLQRHTFWRKCALSKNYLSSLTTQHFITMTTTTTTTTTAAATTATNADWKVERRTLSVGSMRHIRSYDAYTLWSEVRISLGVRMIVPFLVRLATGICKNASITIVISLCLLRADERICMKFDTGEFPFNSSIHTSFGWNRIQINGYFMWRPIHISACWCNWVGNAQAAAQ
jgi:hypothetical protein